MRIRTLGSLVNDHAAALEGRAREREILLELVDRGQPLVAFVHGIGGIGKTTLLRAFSADATARGAHVVLLDCREVEPSEQGFAEALARAAGVNGGLPEVQAALAAHDGRVVLLLDTYELLRLLDAWIRRTLVPALPLNVRVVLAGREAPHAGWHQDYGPLLRSIALGNLAGEDAERLLVRQGVEAREAARINRRVRGHPLGLRLAATALQDRPGLVLEEAAMRAVDELAGVCLAGLEPATRRALEAASVVRRVTLPLLQAMLPGDEDAFERLRALPFVDMGREGLVVHDTVRDVTSSLLRASDPALHRRLRAAAWRQLRIEVGAAPVNELWGHTADLTYLLEHPMIHEAFFGVGSAFAVEPAREADGAAIEALSRAHQPPVLTEWLRAWWSQAPQAFTVARDRAGAVAALRCMTDPRDVGTRLIDRDPLSASWREHLRAHPVARGQTVLFQPFVVSAEAGEDVSPASAALSLDVIRHWMERRSDLRRMYLVVRETSAVRAAVATLGFVPVFDDAVELDGIAYRSMVLDFGPGCVDGWFADQGTRLLFESGSPLDTARRELYGVALTQLEFEFMRRLLSHAGEVVTREALLRDVWGYEWTGGSNVIEVTVSGLRKKLGEHASTLETVRGVGYRLRAPM